MVRRVFRARLYASKVVGPVGLLMEPVFFFCCVCFFAVGALRAAGSE